MYIDTETLEAKLRNQLSPLYGLVDMIILLNTIEPSKKEELFDLIIEVTNQAIKNKKEIDVILDKIDNNRSCYQSKYPELYGKYVKLNDRYETVHIWNEELDTENNGNYKPIEISKETYLERWNN